MIYFLDKRGRPIEWFKGRRLSNFVRFLLYCRDITTDRPASMYPCWICHNCAHAISFDGPREWKDCPKCKVNGEAGVMFLVQRRYRPLTPGLTQGGSKNPPTTPRPDVEVPSQVAKPKEPARDDEEIKHLRAERDSLNKALKICELTARGWPPTDEEAYEGPRLAAFVAIEDLANSHEALTGTLDLFRRSAAGLREDVLCCVPCTCPPEDEGHKPECPLVRVVKLFDDETQKCRVTKAEQTNPLDAGSAAKAKANASFREAGLDPAAIDAARAADDKEYDARVRELEAKCPDSVLGPPQVYRIAYRTAAGAKPTFVHVRAESPTRALMAFIDETSTLQVSAVKLDNEYDGPLLNERGNSSASKRREGS